MTNDIELRSSALLCIQVALLGMIEPHLRAVTLGWSSHSVDAVFYFHGQLTEDDRESVSCVESEVMASFPDHEVSFDSTRLDWPAKPEMLGAWAYWRRERE